MHIYDSIVVIDKKIVEAPFDIKAGKETIEHIPPVQMSFLDITGQFIFHMKNKIRSLRYK